MTRLARLGGILAAAAALAMSAQAQSVDPVADMGAIHETLTDLMAAREAGDVKALIGLLTDDAIVYELDFGADEASIFEREAAQWLRALPNLEVVGAQDITLSGNLAYAAFEASVGRRQGSGAAPLRVRWSVILRRTNDRWQVAHYQVSEDPRP